MPPLRTLPEALADAALTSAGYRFQAGAVETWRSYAEVRHEALRVARALKDAGLRRGDPIALVIPDGHQFLTALFGASIAHLIPASLYPPATCRATSSSPPASSTPPKRAPSSPRGRWRRPLPRRGRCARTCR